MNISIVYATYSNSTALACEFLAKQLQTAGHTVNLSIAAEATNDTLQQPDMLIFSSPSWDYNGEQGMPHEDFTALQERLGAVQLNGKPTAVMALGDSSFTYFCGAAAHLGKWLAEKGGKEAVSPLKIDSYYANEQAAQDQIMQWSKELAAKLAA